MIARILGSEKERFRFLNTFTLIAIVIGVSTGATFGQSKRTVKVEARNHQWEDIVSLAEGQTATISSTVDGEWRWGGDANPAGLAGSAHPADTPFPAPGKGVGELIMERTHGGTKNIVGYSDGGFGASFEISGPATIRMMINDHDFHDNAGAASITVIVREPKKPEAPPKETNETTPMAEGSPSAEEPSNVDVPEASSDDQPKADNGNSDFEWPWFVVGCVLLLVAIIAFFWAFSMPTLSPHQHLLLMWILPLSSGFAAACFAGSLSATGPLGQLAVSATGGFAVWLLSYFLLPKPPQTPD